MMRNFLKPGDYVIPVPAGLPIKLEYDGRGILCNVYDVSLSIRQSDEISKPEKMNDAVREWIVANKIAPPSIKLTGGTTYVQGVLVAAMDAKLCGPLPECCYDKIRSAMKKKSSDLQFYAYTASSLATSFNGALGILRWLDMSGFTTLQGVIASVNLIDSIWSDLHIRQVLSRFTDVPIPALFAVHHLNEFSVVPAGNTQIRIKSTKDSCTNSGHYWTTVEAYDGSTRVFDYATALDHILCPKASIIINDSGDVCYRYAVGDAVRRPKVCPKCGAPLDTSVSGQTKCSNKCCPSYLPSRVNRFLTTLSLPSLADDCIQELIQDKLLMSVSDILLHEQYRDVEIHTTIVKVLTALCPQLTSAESSAIIKFVNRCNNSLATVLYYLQNPSITRSRSDMHVPGIDRVLDWFQSVSNWMDLQTVLDNSNVHIEASIKKFDGDPIFRGTTIAITGSFIHGTSDDIESILNSYSANVVRTYNSNVSIVLVGENMSDIDGSMIQFAKKNNCTVMYELEFFNQFHIDSDLQANLL